MNVFDEMGEFWAEIADQNQTERQIRFLKTKIRPDSWILDLACGTGRHFIPLNKEGYLAVGLDVSPNLLKIAKNRCPRAQLVRADMRFLPFKPKTFSVVFSMDQSFGYLPTEKEDLQSLKDVRIVLVKRGILIVDVFNREYLIKHSNSTNESKLKEYLNFFMLQRRMIDTNSNYLRDSWRIYEKSNGQIRIFEHATRLYTFDELKGLIGRAGFCVIEVFGDYEGQNWTPDSKRLILVALV